MQEGGVSWCCLEQRGEEIADVRKGMQGSGEQQLSPVDASAVLTQLERILASAPFRNSKRYPALLRYVVEKHLNGASSELKERTIAIDVFARDLYYDPAVDPVVRISAGEVRKRLAQYYQETAAANELRIELPVGSYHPDFIVPTPALPIPSVLPVADQSLSLERPRRTNGAVAALCGFVALAVLVSLSIYYLAHRPTALDLFWRPVIQQRHSVMLCLGSIGLQTANSTPDPSHPVIRTKPRLHGGMPRPWLASRGWSSPRALRSICSARMRRPSTTSSRDPPS